MVWRLLLPALPVCMGPAQKKHQFLLVVLQLWPLLVATYWVDSTKPALCRKFPGHAVHMATMHPGDHGFAVAKFSASGGQPADKKQTEIPNLLLHEKIVGKKPATKVKNLKRPAAVLEAAPEAASEHSEQSSEAASVHSDKGVAAPAATPIDMGYSIMTYASTGAVAIRETKLGKRQLFQIRNPKKSIAQLKAILEKAKRKLLQGGPRNKQDNRSIQLLKISWWESKRCGLDL